MSVSVAAIQSHLDYTAWASKALVVAAGRLSREELTRDFGTADKSVLGTLVHVFGADRIWLARLRGEPRPPGLTEADYRLGVIENDWPAIHEGWRQWAAGLTEGDPPRVISYSDLRGNPWRQPLWQLVLHVVNHGTHHRGQVAGFLRAMGHVPPKLDLVQYYRLQQPD
jgi:uncharacterized damage-inducible protein DinB